MTGIRNESGGTSRVLDEVTGALASLSAMLDDEDGVDVFVLHVCEQVLTALPDVDAASITLGQGGSHRTAASTGDVAARLDAVQYRVGSGPCLQAAEEGVLARYCSSEAATLWPELGRAAVGAGVSGFLSAPIVVGGGRSGGINCYRADGRGFTAFDERRLDLYATAAEAVLRVHHRHADALATIARLGTELASQGVVDRATGIVMATRRLGADEALVHLTERSRSEGIDLHELAARFVAG
ncbi:GAF and ANTAR domain-containing protein [Actinokineospora terrae]|uniref:ANTAR domain-containing protein n=1 Tax=Actinokineospora terrae TaxID=155974 RepID=A0A1H9MEA2_9PSEU|nr:GAF and ANTAR domain-containing protein [Actinokineospora terrae]SER21974.1 ANTAR domain-containing protein [Actinokineospora terrae]